MKKAKGYYTNLYFDYDNQIFIKQFNKENIIKFHSVIKKPKKLFQLEVNAIKKLIKIKNKYILTPQIIETDNKNLIIKQKLINGIKFYRFLIKNCNKFYFDKKLKKLFFEFGKFLSEFHLKNIYNKKEKLAHLHGDLNNKNLMFTKKGKLFVFDPGHLNGSIYIDLSKFILNLIEPNPILKIILSKKGLNELKESFLKGYETNIKIDRKILKEYILKKIQKEKNHKLSNKFSYKLKKSIMNYQYKRLYKKIEKGEINI